MAKAFDPNNPKDVAEMDQAAATLKGAIKPLVSVYLAVYREAIEQGATIPEAIGLLAGYIAGNLRGHSDG